MPDIDLKQGFYVGEWEIQPLRNDIIGPGGRKHLEPKVMDVLLVLAEQPGEVVERAELVERVWEGRAMSDEPLNRCISRLRGAFEDPESVKNISRRGYQLAYPIKPLSRWPEWLERAPKILGAAAAIVALAIAAWWIFDALRPPDDSSIAVLPFENLGVLDDDHIAAGFSDATRSRLASVNQLKVVARPSSVKAAQSDDDIDVIARRLDVAYLLNGSVRPDGDEANVSISLVDDDGYVVWSDSYTVQTVSLYALQDDIANEVVSRIAPQLDTPPIQTAQPTTNKRALELASKASLQLNRRGEDPLRLSISLFQQAIELDESFADAYVGLATAYAVLPVYSREAAEGSFDLARAILEQGAQIDPSVDSKGAKVAAFILYHTEFQWIDAETAFDKALDYSPNDSDLLNWYSVFLAGVGRTSESLEVAIRARDVDPLSPVVNQRLAVAHLWAGNDALASEYFEEAKSLGMAPETQPEAYAILLLRQGEYATARSLLIIQQTMMGYDPAWVEALFRAMQEPAYRAEAVEVVENAARSGDITPLHLFGVWLYLDEEERAVDAALALIRDRIAFNSEVLFASEAMALRRHSRFGEIIRGINLDTYWDYFGWPAVCAEQRGEIVCN